MVIRLAGAGPDRKIMELELGLRLAMQKDLDVLGKKSALTLLV